MDRFWSVHYDNRQSHSSNIEWLLAEMQALLPSQQAVLFSNRAAGNTIIGVSLISYISAAYRRLMRNGFFESVPQVSKHLVTFPLKSN